MGGFKVADLFGEIDLRSDKFNTKLDGVRGALAGIPAAAKLASIGMSAALVVGAAKSFTAFASFEKGMNEVFTLLPGISGASMTKMTGQVKSFAKEFGVLPDKVVPALYQAISAGVPPENVFKFLEVAQKAAVGGVTELTTAVDGISSVINAYGSDVISATKASDLMFTAVRLGKTNFEQLSASLFNVVPIASALGVEFGNVTAAIAAMASQGTPTSVATTQLRQMLVELSKAGTATSEVFTKVAGVSFKEFVAQGGNVQQALQLLEEHAGKTGVGVNDLFGSVEAGNAALALTGKGTQKFSDALKGMDESAGATEKAYEQMEQSISRVVDKLKAWAAVQILNVGEKIAGVARFIIDHWDQIKPVMLGIATLITATLLPAMVKFFTVQAASLTESIALWGMYKAEVIAAGLAQGGLPLAIVAGGFFGLKKAIDETASATADLTAKTHSLQGLMSGGMTQDQSDAFEANKDALHALAEEMVGAGATGQELWQQLEKLEAALYDMGVSVVKASPAEFTAALQELRQTMPKVRGEVDGLKGSQDKLGDATDATAKKVEFFAGMTREEFAKWRRSSVESINGVDDTLEKLAGRAKLTADDILKSFTKQLDAMRDYEDNWSKLLKRGLPEDLAMQLQEMGIEGAKVVAALAGANRSEFAKIIATWEKADSKAADISKSIGQSIDEGVAAGIRSSASVVANAMGAVVTMVIDGAKRKLGIKSPSKVFMEIGKQIVQGLANGVSGFGKLADNALAKMLNQLSKSAEKYRKDIERQIDKINKKLEKDLANDDLTKAQKAALEKAAKQQIRALNQQLAEYERHVEKLQRRGEKLQAVFEKLNDKIRDFKDTVRSGFDDLKKITSFDITDEFLSKSLEGRRTELHNFLSRQAKDAKKLADALKAVAQAGLNRFSLAELASEGPSALPILETLLSDRSLIEFANDARATIEMFTKDVSDSLSDTFFGAEMARAQNELDRFAQALEKVTGKLTGSPALNNGGGDTIYNNTFNVPGAPTDDLTPEELWAVQQRAQILIGTQ